MVSCYTRPGGVLCEEGDRQIVEVKNIRKSAISLGQMLCRATTWLGRRAGSLAPSTAAATTAAPSSSSSSASHRAAGGSREFCVDANATKAAKTVVRQRSVYNEQLTELRKGWRDEMELRRVREERRAAAERQRLVLDKAIRLREKRKASAVRQEQAKLKREDALQLYREKLARNHVFHEQRVAQQQNRYLELTEALREESATWITYENMDSRIVEELFAKPATTGLVTGESRHWRHHLMTINLRRVVSPEFVAENAGSSSLADRLQQRGQLKSVKRMLVEDFLEPLIGTGEERANYQEILDKFAKEFADLDVGDEDLDSYFEYITNKSPEEVDVDSALYQKREDEDGNVLDEELSGAEASDGAPEEEEDEEAEVEAPVTKKTKKPFVKR